jgi:sugar phosphate isomerase/epimerase
MQLGFSTWCFHKQLGDGSMSILDVIDWIAASEGTHMEIATVAFAADAGGEQAPIEKNPELVAQIKEHAAKKKVTLSGMCIGAQFLDLDPQDYTAEMERVKRHVDVCDALGIAFLRHDVAPWGKVATDQAEFEAALPILASASKEIAKYAAQFGITTSVENHGMFMNGSERIRRLIYLVDEPNFKTTLDIGNFMCVDEDAYAATIGNLSLASVVQLKDFFVRDFAPGDGWLATPGGHWLLGSIVGHGDLPVRRILGAIKKSGFDGFLSIEFEGLEDSTLGAAKSAANINRILSSI